MKFYIAGADDARFYMIRRENLNLMFTAGHYWSKKGFRKFNTPIKHNSLFLDSGAFQLFGNYKDFPFSSREYIAFVNSLNPNYFATLDYPCEPFMRQKNGFSVEQCITKTVENTCKLADLSTTSQLIPVLQGWTEEDYLDCIDKYRQQGLLRNYLGVGTLCRRGDVSRIKSILRAIRRNIPKITMLHGFGVKIGMLKDPETYNLIQSCDSAAWVNRVRGGELCIFTGKKLITVPYKGLSISGFERLSISVAGYVAYVEHLISEHENHLRMNQKIDQFSITSRSFLEMSEK